jgi:hypothetical protein
VSVDSQLASPHAGLLFFIEFGFAGGTMRRCTWSHTLPWNGHDWIGLSAVVSVSPIRTSERLQFPPLELGLNVANTALLALALGSVQEYRRRPITLWLQVLDDTLQSAGEPEIFWAGLMDQVEVETGDGEAQTGSITLRCEMSGRSSGAARSLRLNHAQHVLRHPGDTGLSRIEQITSQPPTWLSKRFQRI